MTNTVQGRIAEVVKMVMENLSGELLDEDKEVILDNIEDLGYQWQKTNAHVKALCISAAMMNHTEDEDINLSDDETLKKLEAEGSDTLIKVLGIHYYSCLVMDLLEKAIEA